MTLTAALPNRTARAAGRLGRLAAALSLALATVGCLLHPSPYAMRQAPEVKALSVQEVDDYLAAKGMGLASAVESSGRPAPAHVLELAGPLALTPAQRERTEAIYKDLQHHAIDAGRDLIDAERSLDRLFAARTITTVELERSLARIAGDQARVREAHRDAQLAQAAVLTPGQVAVYRRLRTALR